MSRRRWVRRWLVLMALLGALSVLAAVPAQAAVGISTSEVRWFADGSVVPGAKSTLMRTDGGVTMTLHTFGLPAHHTFTVWWVIFNHPENCEHPTPFSRCGEGDLLLAGGGEGTVLYAAGNIADQSGRAVFAGHLAVGDTSGAIDDGPGLTNPHGAEVHLVVRDHGPIVPGLVVDQLTTLGGGCIDPPPGTGMPGSYPCQELQFSIHMP